MNTKFNKGHKPFNKGKKAKEYLTKEVLDKIAETQFKKDENTGDKHPKWKGGIQTPTRDCTLIWTGNGTRKRLPRVIYEENFGAIPKGHVIYHLDKVKTNDSPDNLIAVSRAELMRLNKENLIHELK